MPSKKSKKEAIDAHIHKGTPLLVNGKLEEAAIEYRAAITIDPDDYSGWFHLSLVLFVGYQLDDAKELRIKAQKLFEKQSGNKPMSDNTSYRTK